eukprot:gnl/Trimastix_PCT/2307.p1 GENE.gnl/Trimastix_PCT/2307~~gnl/Trimastix_PCT/2307.p1  ORF type:complete len:491 (+),score=178.22 gnl/Trimastix_PCT/2307:70-1542(+)
MSSYRSDRSKCSQILAREQEKGTLSYKIQKTIENKRLTQRGAASLYQDIAKFESIRKISHAEAEHLRSLIDRNSIRAPSRASTAISQASSQGFGAITGEAIMPPTTPMTPATPPRSATPASVSGSDEWTRIFQAQLVEQRKQEEEERARVREQQQRLRRDLDKQVGRVSSLTLREKEEERKYITKIAQDAQEATRLEAEEAASRRARLIAENRERDRQIAAMEAERLSELRAQVERDEQKTAAIRRQMEEQRQQEIEVRRKQAEEMRRAINSHQRHRAEQRIEAHREQQLLREQMQADQERFLAEEQERLRKQREGLQRERDMVLQQRDAHREKHASMRARAEEEEKMFVKWQRERAEREVEEDRRQREEVVAKRKIVNEENRLILNQRDAAAVEHKQKQENEHREITSRLMRETAEEEERREQLRMRNIAYRKELERQIREDKQRPSDNTMTDIERKLNADKLIQAQATLRRAGAVRSPPPRATNNIIP